MFDGKSPFVLLDDARASGAAPARLYRDPVAVIRADKMEELEACFESLSLARSEGTGARTAIARPVSYRHASAFGLVWNI